jgi:hypothetical protein
VLLNIDDYQTLAEQEPKRTLADCFAMSESDYFEYEFPRFEGDFREVDFG